MSQSGRTPPTRKERRATERASAKAPITGPAQPAWRSPIALLSVGAVIVGVVIIAVLVLGNSRSGDTAIRDAAGVAPVAMRDGRSLGNVDAPVRIDVYEDPQCPVCGRFTRELEPLLISSFINDGTVRLNYHDMAFIGVPGESLDAAVGMRAADQLAQRFWDYQAIVFANQNGENQGAFSRDRLVRMAEQVGLDGVAFKALLDDPALIAAVQAETEQGRSLGVNSTPTLIVNGQVDPGLPTWDQLKAMIVAAAAASPIVSPGPSPDGSLGPSPVGSPAVGSPAAGSPAAGSPAGSTVAASPSASPIARSPAAGSAVAGSPAASSAP